jgi:uncharacterized protein YegL
MADALDSVEFAENSDPRVPCVLLLDTSSSMRGSPIDSLNRGLVTFKEELSEDELAARRAEVAVVTFSSRVDVVQDFVTADNFEPPELTVSGKTSMGSGIEKALSMVDDRKSTYKDEGVKYYRPWVFMITDGAPTDRVERARKQVHKEEDRDGVAFFAVGVQEADMSKLRQISQRDPLKLQGLKFAELFQWLSDSMAQVSSSNPDADEEVPLNSPSGWAAV